jgi:hypothetical protein
MHDHQVRLADDTVDNRAAIRLRGIERLKIGYRCGATVLRVGIVLDVAVSDKALIGLSDIACDESHVEKGADQIFGGLHPASVVQAAATAVGGTAFEKVLRPIETKMNEVMVAKAQTIATDMPIFASSRIR